MALKKITSSLYQISLGPVNAFFIDCDEPVLIDTGFKGNHSKIYKILETINRKPTDIKHVVLTHSHPDHAGALADIVSDSGAKTYMHFEDAALIRVGLAGRLPHEVAPELLNKILYQLFIKKSHNKNDIINIDVELKDNDFLPIGGGIHVISTPGHSLGHICLLIENQNCLIAGDMCSNMMGLKYSTVYENMEVGRQSILKATGFPFEIAAFGHGNPILKQAQKHIFDKFSN